MIQEETSPPSADGQKDPAYIRVAKQLREDIVAGTWPAGARIPMQLLVDRYLVSAMPVRDALNQLLGEGLVEMRAHRGFTIPEMDEPFLRNIYDIRRSIETMLTAEAARRIDEPTIARAEDAADNFARAAQSGDVLAALRFNREFHHVVNGAAENPSALDILDGRTALVYSLRRKFGYGATRSTEMVVAQHATIVAALKAGDPEWAAAAAHAHCASAGDEMLAIFRSYSDGKPS